MANGWRGRWRGLALRVEPSDDWSARGPSLHVGRGDGAAEWLHFDCTPADPRVRVTSEGVSADETASPRIRDTTAIALDDRRDPIAETFARLAPGPAALLEAHGLAGHIAAGDERAASETPEDRVVLRDAERAMRHRAAVLDELDPVRLRERRSEKWHTYPSDVLPAWVAEMDFPVAAPIQDAVRRFADGSDFGYPIRLRDTGLSEVFAERMTERFGWSPDPGRVLILSEVVQGMYVALEAYSRPGDGVVVQTPIYPPFLGAVRDTGRRLVENRMQLVDGRMRFDLDALEASTDAGCRVVLLCNPHNPSGRMHSRGELERIARLAIERELVVVSDEIHADLVFDGRPFVPFASLGEDVAQRTVTLTSVSKAFNVPGLRAAIAHFGTAELQRRFEAATPPHTRGGIGLLGLHATIAAWRFGQPWLDEVVPYLAGNRDFVAGLLAERIPEIGFVHPEATYLAWLDCRALPGAGGEASARSPAARFLRDGQVALSDGRLFGPGWEGFARLNLGTSRALLAEVVARMAKALGR